MGFSKKHFLDLRTLTEQEIHYILNSAEKMKYMLTSNKGSVTPHLKGKTVATLFHEESSRSKLSYELAAKNLNAKVISITTSRQFDRGETLKDVGKYVDQIGADYIVLRHHLAGGAHHLSKYVHASVINAGDGKNENPSQSLIDLLTISEHKSSFEGLKVVMIGDIMHNRVAKSNIWALKKLGAKVHVVGPNTIIPQHIETAGVKVHNTVATAIQDADVVMTLKVRNERQKGNLIPSVDEYRKLYKLTEQRLEYAKKDVIVMHPGPINRGIEISSEVIDGEHSILDKQQVNGVAVRMALFHLLGKGNGGIRSEF